MNYDEFIRSKTRYGTAEGIERVTLNNMLFDFQNHLVEWSLSKGRSANFEDCWLGKTPLQLEWAKNVSQSQSGNVLILTPLAVSRQTIREGEKFGIDVVRSHADSAGLSVGAFALSALKTLNTTIAGLITDSAISVTGPDGTIELTDSATRAEFREVVRDMDLTQLFDGLACFVKLNFPGFYGPFVQVSAIGLSYLDGIPALVTGNLEKVLGESQSQTGAGDAHSSETTSAA
jgi:hypothetical protein